MGLIYRRRVKLSVALAQHQRSGCVGVAAGRPYHRVVSWARVGAARSRTVLPLPVAPMSEWVWWLPERLRDKVFARRFKRGPDRAPKPSPERTTRMRELVARLEAERAERPQGYISHGERPL